MSRKETRTKPRDILLLLIYRIFEKAVGYLPLWSVQFGCRIFFLFLYPVVGLLFGLRRRIARNLRAAYGDAMTVRQSKTIARRVLYNQLLFFIELFFYYHPRNKKRLREMVSIEGVENLTAARERSRGVIGISGHLGSFQLMMLRLSLDDDRFIALIKNPESKILSDAWIKYMDDFGLKTIMIRNRVSAIKQIIRELRNSAFIMFVADEFTRRGGYIVKFFEKRTLMAAGPAQLSLKMRVPMLPCFIIRHHSGRYRIIIEQMIEIAPSGDYEADCRSLTQKRIDILERYIRQYTDQWLWTQTRWKKKVLRDQ